DSSGNVINTVDVPAEHVRAIAVGPDGRVWLGTAGTGKMYELSGTDLSMVIDTFSAEISALAPGSHGVWFSTVAAPVVMGSGNNRAENMNPRSRADDSLDEKGSLWFMDYTGRAPREVWETRSAPIFDLVVINDKPVMACGDDGSIIQLDDDRRVTLLTTLPERQIVCLETDASGTLWAGAAGTAAVFKYTDRRRGTGSLESPVLDAGYFARWGRMLLRGRDLEDTTLALETRSGNSDEPGEEWSDWIAPGENRSILSPPARYFQWRLTLTRTERLNPVVDTVAVSRLTVNQPPYITRLKVFPVTRGQFIERPGRGKTYQQVMKDGIRIEYALPNSATNGFTKGDWMALRGMRTVAWDSGDPDNEPLEFQIEIASNNPAPVWLLLENAYPDPIFSF
ncbi:MAG TPA: two-component regulator propeller domain-containing protein, partial [bacterium]|nr:two-component regulator propeller domain-containing protein [bacterium]